MDAKLRARIAGQVSTGRGRARALRLPASLTVAEWTAILVASAGQCAKCGAVLGLECLVLDHVIPIRNGGPHVVTNVQPLCAPCNLRKHNRNPDGSRTPLPLQRRVPSPTRKRFDLRPSGLYGWNAIAGTWDLIGVPDFSKVLA